MKSFRAVFIIEWKRLIHITPFFLLFFYGITLYFVQIGINQYKSILYGKEKFQETEKLKATQYINYNQYGAYGFRVLYLPSSLSVFFTNIGAISELTANVDATERLNIYRQFKGRSLFIERVGDFKDFSGLLMLFGSMLALYIGFHAFLYKDYIRFLISQSHPGVVFWSVMSARIVWLFLFFGGLAAAAILQLKVNHVAISRNDYCCFFLYISVWLLSVLFFLFVGAIAGNMRSRITGIVLLIMFWFLSVYLVPGLVNTLIAHGADRIAKEYKIEFEKLKVLMQLEKRALAQRSTVTDNLSVEESKRHYAESYWNNQFRVIQQMERDLETSMNQNVERYQVYSIFFPSSFYLSTSAEISSQGYRNFIDFYRFLQQTKERFVRYFIDKRYYENNSKVVPFVKENSYLYYANGRLPGKFGLGVVLLVLYCLLTLAVSARSFKKAIIQ